MGRAIWSFTVRRYAKRGICRRHAVSVRLSVCVSVTLRYCIKMAKHRITQIMPQTGSDMPYGHLISVTVMTLGVCQGYSLTASFFLYWQAHRSSLCHSRASCTERGRGGPKTAALQYQRTNSLSLAITVTHYLFVVCCRYAIIDVMKTVQCSASCPPRYRYTKSGWSKIFCTPTFQTVAPSLTTDDSDEWLDAQLTLLCSAVLRHAADDNEQLTISSFVPTQKTLQVWS